MLTKNDKSAIGEIVEEIVDKRISKFADEVVELFTVLTDKISDQFDRLNAKIDSGLARIDKHELHINDHERRIENLEEKVYTT